MKWSDVFTIPDDSIIREGSVDPMGFQMIWTQFGQKVFQNKLTTVATDIRNYTINLLHHHVLFTFERQHREQYVKALSHFSGYRREYDLKAGLLIFLEDLLVYSLVSQEDAVEVAGLLGSFKARAELNKPADQIILSAEQRAGVLVRQIQLGVNGRYKGPFMNMGLLTTNFNYYDEEWLKVGEVFNKWPHGKMLSEKLLTILLSLVSSGNGEFPVTTWSECSDDTELLEMFANCFGSQKLPDVITAFWVNRIGLSEGAAKSVFDQLRSSPDRLDPNVIIREAYKVEDDPLEKEKLSQIIKLEPFLTICAQVFYLLADASTKRLSDVIPEVSDLAEVLTTEDVRPLAEENKRLKFLIEQVENAGGDSTRLVHAIVDYHSKIMEERGGAAWVEIRDESVKHLVSQGPRWSTEELVQNNHWYNDYYLSALRQIERGLYVN